MGATCCKDRKKRWKGREINMDRYGEASRKFRRAVRRLIRMHISVVAFSSEPFSAYKCVGVEEACRAEEEEFEKILAKGPNKKGTSSSTHENRDAHRDVRYDPADGLPLTKLELDIKYKNLYTPEELDAYWEEMPATAPEQDSWVEVEAEDAAAAAEGATTPLQAIEEETAAAAETPSPEVVPDASKEAAEELAPAPPPEAEPATEEPGAAVPEGDTSPPEEPAAEIEHAPEEPTAHAADAATPSQETVPA